MSHPKGGCLFRKSIHAYERKCVRLFKNLEIFVLKTFRGNVVDNDNGLKRMIIVIFAIEKIES